VEIRLKKRGDWVLYDGKKKKIEKRFGCSFAYKMKDMDLSWEDVCLLRKQRKDHRKKKKRDKNNNKKNE